ncbi:MAG: ArdC-like ssDNA-binding domain-containing protein [Burkholderiaceae bacterium]
MKPDRINPLDAVTHSVIAKLEDGTAPWLRSWETAPPIAVNPVSGNPYKGINAVVLALADKPDPRWLTYKQANDRGWRLEKGASAKKLLIWQSTVSQEKRGPDGLALLDAGGRRVRETVKLARPRLMAVSVYNASQIRGLRDYSRDTLSNSSDAGTIGTPANAVEAVDSLRNEISAYLAAASTGRSFTPRSDAQTVEQWVDLLQRDPNAMLRAARPARAAPTVARYREPRGDTSSPPDSSQPIRSTDSLPEPLIVDPIPSKVPIVSVDVKKQFAEALANMGLIIEGEPIMDGTLQRVAVERPNGRKLNNVNGMYVGHLDGHPAGYIENHYRGTKVKWKADVKLAQPERDKLARDYGKQKGLREQALKDRRERVAKRAARYLSLLPPASNDHPYLQRKGVEATPGLKANRKGQLVMPIHNAAGEVKSFQKINANGFKGLKRGGKKSGNFFLIDPKGQAAKTDTILVAEGYSTGATLNKATGIPVVVAVDSGNLAAAALAAQQAYRQAMFLIAGDDDHSASRNVGRVKAEAAAVAVRGRAIYPVFGQGKPSAQQTDWNDLARTRNLGEVRKQVERSRTVARADVARKQAAARKADGRKVSARSR